jgi:hypothetical protein
MHVGIWRHRSDPLLPHRLEETETGVIFIDSQ